MRDNNIFTHMRNSAVLFSLYILSALCMQSLFGGNDVIRFPWLVAGPTIYLLALHGYGILGVSLAAIVVGNLLQGTGLETSLLNAVRTVLATAWGGWLYQRTSSTPLSFSGVKDYLRLFGVALALGLGAAGITSLQLIVGLPMVEIHSELHRIAGTAFGFIMSMAPLLVWHNRRSERKDIRTIVEGVAIIGLALLVGQVVFLDWFHSSLGQIARGYWMFLFVTIAALRLRSAGTIIVMLFTAIQALCGALGHLGFFSDDLEKTHLLNYFFYMLSISSDGLLVAMLFTQNDVDKKELQEKEEQYRLLSDNLPGGMTYQLDMGLSGEIRQFTYISAGVEKLHDIKTEAAMRDAHLLYRQYLEEDQAKMAKEEARALATMTPFFTEAQYRSPSGAVRWSLISSSPHHAPNGHLLWDGIEIDITKLKQAEAELQATEGRLSEAQRVAHVGSWEWDPETDKNIVSDELCRIFGLPTGQSIPNFKEQDGLMYPHETWMLLNAAGQEALQTGNGYDLEVEALRKGELIWVNSRCEVVRHAQGHAVGLRGSVQDITERKRAEEKLKQSEQLIWNILDAVDEGFIVIDRDFRIQMANRAYCEQTSCSPEGISGMNCYTASHKTDRPCYEDGKECAVRMVFEDGQAHSTIHKHFGPDNAVLFVETKAFPLKDSAGTVTSAIEVITNITEKHMLEEERLKTQKLEAVGTLAGGIAHDFNNLLQGVFGYLSLAKLHRNDRDKGMAALEQAEKALHMTVKLTNQLLTFSKGGKPVRKTIDILPVVENSAKFALSGSRSDIRLHADNKLFTVEADEGQISQVVQNIVLNADQAMPDAGRVEIALTKVLAPDPALPNDLAKGEYIAISISDTGVGIPEKYLHRIFDPYFTTKEKGSGLGLATSYSIIKNHNGVIDVTSTPGRGTTFCIYLPAASAAEPEEQPVAWDPAAERKGRILVMDDEEFIRNIAGELLLALGHEAAFASNGTEAIALWQEAKAQGNPFDIVILDLTIRGGMGGSETLKKLFQTDPLVTAVVSSGYSDDSTVAAYKQEGFAAVLKKPYSIDQLREIIAGLLQK